MSHAKTKHQEAYLEDLALLEKMQDHFEQLLDNRWAAVQEMDSPDREEEGCLCL